MAITGVLAVTNQDIDEALNTSSVEIKLETYTLNSENEEIKYDNDYVLVPGEEVSFIPKISNLGSSTYVRFKVNYISDELDFTDYVTGFSNNFTKHGDYYYYNDILNSNETIKLFDRIKIPNNAYSYTDNNKLMVEIIAEAIQENSFTPDYNLDNPWKDIVPVDNVNGSYDVNIGDDSPKVSVKYDNISEDDIEIDDDFLKNTSNTLPGDVFTENIEIENSNNGKTKYYLNISVNENEEETIKLLNEIYLIINNKDGTVYDGKFLTNGKVQLTELDKNEQENIELTISVPEELSNEYANITPKFSVIFSTDRENNNVTNNNDNNNNNNSETGVIKSITKIFKGPNTGDKIDTVLILFFISTIGLIATMILDYRERKK